MPFGHGGFPCTSLQGARSSLVSHMSGCFATVRVCRLLRALALRKEVRRLCLSRCILNVAWQEVVSRGDHTEADRLGNLRAQHAKFGVSSIFLNSEMRISDFQSRLGFKPKLSSLCHSCWKLKQNQTRNLSRHEENVPLLSCSSNLQFTGIVNGGSSSPLLSWPMLSF